MVTSKNVRSTILAIGTMLIASNASASTTRAVLFGVVPQQSATRLAQIWVPFVDRLSKESGVAIKFATMKDIPSFEKCLAKGAYDIAYMNPYHYTVFSQRAGYRAFARQSQKRLQGLIVVRQDSPVKNIIELNQKTLAFPSPAAFGASVLPRAEMRARGIQITPQYVKSHDSVYRSVALGVLAAGGGVKRTFGNIPADLRSQLRVIYQTEKYTPHAFASNSNLGKASRKRITEAFFRIARQEPKLVRALGMKGFQSAGDRDWDDVRNLNLTQKQTDIADQGTVKCRFD